MSVLCCGHVGLLRGDTASGLQAKRIDDLLAEGKAQRHRGLYAEALATLQVAARIAHQNHETALEARALASSAGCQIGLFRYRQALADADQALQLAIKTNDTAVAGAAASNLATIYVQLGDFANAAKRANQSVAYLRQSNRKEWLAKALLNAGDIEFEQNELSQANQSYLESIRIAQNAGLSDAEGAAELHFGESLVGANELVPARNALVRAERLFVQNHDDDVAAVQVDIADLDYREHKYLEALQILDKAVGSHHALTISPYIAPHLRGQILLAMGRQWEALAEFRKAANQASKWRQGALPGDATGIRTVSYLHDIYQDFTELAAALAIKTNNTMLAREAIEVLSDSRAASLREQMTAALERKGTLPPEYFELLSELQSAQARATLNPNSANQAALEQIRLQLSEQQNRFGIATENFSDKVERIASRKSLKSIQRGLGGSELLLSFCLGKEKSFLWAITAGQVKLYELPPEAQLAMHAAAFSDAVHRGQDATTAGRVFSAELFSHLDHSLWEHPDWLIVGDGALLNGVPFAALPAPSGSEPTYIATDHRIRLLPSASLIGGTPPIPDAHPVFVGIADPIYNLADARRKATQLFVKAKQTNSEIILARLVGSDREVRNAAKMSGLIESQFLTGAGATVAGLRNTLLSKPQILHFAVHVVSPDEKPEQAALALSLTGDQMPELLTPEAIAAFHVPGSLVVLSGCSSQQGKSVPSAGVVGLSRAWLLAGAAAVVVSAWPTPDDSGRFFSSFYRHLQVAAPSSASLATRAAQALQMAQADMQAGGGYRSSPSFWAAYSIISKE